MFTLQSLLSKLKVESLDEIVAGQGSDPDNIDSHEEGPDPEGETSEEDY